jgi:hypothetical protein
MNRNQKLYLLICIVSLFLGILQGCSSAAEPIIVEPTEPAMVESQEIEAEEPIPAATATLLPKPTQAPPTQIPTPAVEDWLVDLEWPSSIYLGESDVVRLALSPSETGYALEIEFEDHETLTEDITIQRPVGYLLNAVARLEGVMFDISPVGEQSLELPPGETITWHWTITSKQPGRQRLSISLVLRWTPLGASGGSTREFAAYSKGLDVRVESILGVTKSQALVVSFAGIFFGGGLGLFALFSRRPGPKRVIRDIHPNQGLVLEPAPGIDLSAQESGLFKALFKPYSRVVIDKEFLSGYSGARAFMALPVRADGKVDAYTIVKVSQRESIQREFQNYETYVKDTLPPITARIQHAPVALRSSRLAGLKYTFIGAPGTTPVSLRLVLLDDPDPALLTRIFEIFGPNWWMQRRAHTFRLCQEYDRKLPTHYVIAPAQGRGRILDGRLPPSKFDLKIGDLVQVRNFPLRELRAGGKQVSLTGHTPPGQPALRARWLGPEVSKDATGRIVATRSSYLRDRVSMFDLLGLPDPLEKLPDLLNETVNGSRSTIHGDLNLENVLVGPGEFVWLIDFAETREGHPLYDFAQLETEIIAHILSEQIPSAQDYLQGIRNGDFPLLVAVENIASRCLFNTSKEREYRLALMVTCLGALKYQNLGDHAKHLLYLTAAHIGQEL